MMMHNQGFVCSSDWNRKVEKAQQNVYSIAMTQSKRSVETHRMVITGVLHKAV